MNSTKMCLIIRNIRTSNGVCVTQCEVSKEIFPIGLLLYSLYVITPKLYGPLEKCALAALNIESTDSL